VCKIRIGAVVPVYNHPRHLKRLVKHLHEQQLAVILVDDGSTDESAVMIDVLQQEHAERVHVIRHPHNRGKGAAVRSGLLQADALGWSHVLQVDADGQHHWQDIERFVAQAEQHPEHMIIGKPIFDDYRLQNTFLWPLCHPCLGMD
jgi:glycosyltransferase involved in cell wall biosynthesis